ncbi:MAG: HPr family phosphocarrier protein [Chlamydiota bacterium]
MTSKTKKKYTYKTRLPCRANGLFVVKNGSGLHTRPSTELVKCAANFRSEITLHYKDCSVNAKSLLGILMLAAEKGAKIRVEAYGEDAREAVESLLVLAGEQFKIKY